MYNLMFDNPQVPRNYLDTLKALVATEEARQQALNENADLHISLEKSKEWYTIKRVATANKTSWRHFDWHKLKALSENMGYDVKKVFDANYSEVNAYHICVWRAAYPTLKFE